jgi:biopolymer transport protein ExbD
MKFPRNARLLRTQFEAAPFASVLFLLVIFILLGSMVYTPGVRVSLQLPRTEEIPGTDHPSVSVAVTADGQYYLENQLIDEAALTNRLRSAVRKSPEPLTLVLQADKAVTEEILIHISILARRSGIQDLLLATLPRAFDSPAPGTHP